MSLNAIKFASAATSQASESLNHSMCSKNPKSTAYCTSESSDYRFAATVAQKNLGTHYLAKTFEILKIRCGKYLNKYINHSQNILLKKREITSKPSLKKKKIASKS